MNKVIKAIPNKFLFYRSLSGDRNSSNQLRVNEINIQMISDKFHKILFGNKCVTKTDLNNIYSNLQKFNINLDKTTINKTIDFDLPPLLNENIEIHLEKIAFDLNRAYLSLLDQVKKWRIQPMPTEWSIEEGWTRYSDGGRTHVSAPVGDALVFDVETLPVVTQNAVMAVALVDGYWHSWTSRYLSEPDYCFKTSKSLTDLIPIYAEGDTSRPKCVIGHFVSFDRARILEEYQIEGTGARFIDTMSLYVAVRGGTPLQKLLKEPKNKSDSKMWRQYYAQNKDKDGLMDGENFESLDKWINEACLTSLVNVYDIYYPRCDLSNQKDKRNTFINGTIDDVRNDFQSLMTYCATDVLMTVKIFEKLWHEFRTRFVHPALLTGMLEMGSLYLPVNNNFNAFINKASTVYNNISTREGDIMNELAQEALKYGQNNEYVNDPWLWDLDWSLSKDSSFPKWYNDLIKHNQIEINADSKSDNISIETCLAIKLLKLKWDGLPLHYDMKMKWGILIPGKYNSDCNYEEFMDSKSGTVLQHVPIKMSYKKERVLYFPFKEYVEFWLPVFMSRLDKVMDFLKSQRFKPGNSDELINHVINVLKVICISPEHHSVVKSKLNDIQSILLQKRSSSKRHENYQPNMYDFQMNDLNCLFDMNEPLQTINPDLPFVWFLPLSHENKNGHFCTSPFSKSFLNNTRSDRLTSHGYQHYLKMIIEGRKSGVFWEKCQKRVLSQIIVDTPKNSAILPQVIATGALTRQSVEKLWLTDNYSVKNIIASELKSMVQSPSGWVIVGANVDKLYHWIVSLLGDSVNGVHGGTPYSWLFLQDSKEDETDFHTIISKSIGISRDSAKVLSYSLCFGAGTRTLKDLLLRFYPEFQSKDALLKIKSLILETKGQKTNEGWVGGSNSDFFSKLEEISQNVARTLILDARISKSMEYRFADDKYMSSKCNWFIQSSIVDYFHCLITFVKSLINQFKVNARLCICTNSEIRYLCHEKDQYRLALILQISNLFTKSIFARKLNLKDLPQSTAFFSEIDIDYCLRRDPLDECRTPSNPEGMLQNYNIGKGKSINIFQLLEKTKGKL